MISARSKLARASEVDAETDSDARARSKLLQLMPEFGIRFGAGNEDWIVVTTLLEDPQYLNEPFLTSTHFKKEPDGSKWDPTTCNTRNAR